jgi:cyclase
MTIPPRALALLTGILLAVPYLASAQEDRFANVQVTATPVSGSVYMLTGQGGNIGASVGADGTLIIDDQFAPLADKIQAALNGLGGGKPRLVLNTHFHGDHTGSNAHFGREGTIIAHDNVRLRLLDSEEELDRAALPLVTFDEHLTVHFNDEEIQIIHLPAGHTDGDSAVWFKNANVVHMGDQLFSGSFPFIDQASGGTVSGYLKNLETMLAMIPADAKVIPGHGPLSGTDAIEAAITMIRATRLAVKTALDAGQTLDQIQLGDQWAEWGAGFINNERWIQILANDLGAGR